MLTLLCISLGDVYLLLFGRPADVASWQQWRHSRARFTCMCCFVCFLIVFLFFVFFNLIVCFFFLFCILFVWYVYTYLVIVRSREDTNGVYLLPSLLSDVFVMMRWRYLIFCKYNRITTHSWVSGGRTWVASPPWRTPLALVASPICGWLLSEVCSFMKLR